MNRIYRLVWNHSLHAFVVGSEFAAARGKRSGGQKLGASGLPLISGICGALALALAAQAHASDPRLEDLQSLVAKYATPAPQVTIGQASSTLALNAGTPLSASVGAAASVSTGSAITVSASASASASVKLPTIAATVRKVTTPVTNTVVPVVAKITGPQPAQVIAGIAEQANQGVGALVQPIDQIVAAKGAAAVNTQAGLTAVIGGVLPGKENGGNPLHEGVQSTVGLVEGAVKGVGGLLGDGKSGVTGLLGGVLPGKENGGNPVREGVHGTVGLVEGTVKDVVKGTGVGDLLQGVVGALKPVLNGAGEVVGGTVKAVTGSEQLAGGLEGAVKGVAGGLQQITDNVVDTNLTGVVQGVGNTVNTVVGSTVGGVTGTVDGLIGANNGLGGLGNIVTGITNGVTGGLTNIVGGLTGTPPTTPTTPTTPTAPGGGGGGPMLPAPAAASSGPTGLIIGNGGALGSVQQVLDPTLKDILKTSDPYYRNGGLALSSDNVTQSYARTSLLGLPIAELKPVGSLVNSLGQTIGGPDSKLTLIGGVTSESYIKNIQRGGDTGLLGLLLPDTSPAWASECLNVLGLVKVDCWAVPAAQNHQVLIGDGAYANGSKEVVIGTGAQHRLPDEQAKDVFTTAGMQGVPSADYDARKGHSVVIGDSASGSADGQTLLGASATSNKANSVALGYKSNANRGGADNYTAFGLSAPQSSIGEVAVGSDGRNRQITHVAAGSQDNDAVNLAQLKGALAGISTGSAFAVTYELDGAGNPNYGKVNLSGTGAGTVIGNLAAGQVSATSKEAVNGSQLHGLAQSTASHLGGGATVAGDGTVSAPTYTINTILAGGQMQSGNYRDVGSAFDAVSQSLANLRGNGGNPGGSDPLAVRYQAGADGKPTNKVVLSGDGTGAAVAVGNVAAGKVASGSLDAVNGDQLHQTNDAVAQYLGAGAKYDSTSGQWSGPQYQITKVAGDGSTSKVTATDVGKAFDAMDGSINTINQRISNIQQGGAGSEYFSVNSTKAPAAASGQDSVAAGPAAVASGDHSVAVGDGAQATAAGSVALGAGSKADRANTVSVGAAGAERQVVNVADGSQATDAVNLRQLQASQQGTLRYDQNSDGSTNYNSVTLGKSGAGPTVVRNVAAGTADTDAVNVSQLNQGLGKVMDWSKSYTDQRFSDIGRDIKRVDDRAAAGVASAMAIAGLPQPSEAGRRMASVAAGSFNGESGMAVGISGVSEGGRWIYKLSGSTNTRGDGGVSVGAGFQW